LFPEICTSIRCIRTLGNYLPALACAQPTWQHAALPSQPLTLQLAFGQISLDLPRIQNLLRRPKKLSRSEQAENRSAFTVFKSEHFHCASFGMVEPSLREGYRMPQWTLNCHNCNRVFSHSKIEPQSDDLFYDSLWPYRPEVPEGGTTVSCPHCKNLPPIGAISSYTRPNKPEAVRRPGHISRYR
jgi:hypothetical protein